MSKRCELFTAGWTCGISRKQNRKPEASGRFVWPFHLVWMFPVATSWNMDEENIAKSRRLRSTRAEKSRAESPRELRPHNILAQGQRMYFLRPTGPPRSSPPLGRFTGSDLPAVPQHRQVPLLSRANSWHKTFFSRLELANCLQTWPTNVEQPDGQSVLLVWVPQGLLLLALEA